MSEEREPTRQERREAREIARDTYRGITEEGRGSPRTMQLLTSLMAEAGIDFRALARSDRSNEEIEAALNVQIRENAVGNVRTMFAELQAGDMGNRGRRSNVEKINEHVAFLGGDYGVLDASGARASTVMRAEFEEAARTASLARATSDFNSVESGKSMFQNTVVGDGDSVLGLFTITLFDDKNSRIQSIGRDLQRAGINADTNNDRRYDHAEVAAALGREVPETPLMNLPTPQTPAPAQPEGPVTER